MQKPHQGLTLTFENTPQRIRDRYHSLSSYAKEHSFGELDEDVVVIDTETTVSPSTTMS